MPAIVVIIPASPRVSNELLPVAGRGGFVGEGIRTGAFVGVTADVAVMAGVITGVVVMTGVSVRVIVDTGVAVGVNMGEVVGDCALVGVKVAEGVALSKTCVPD